MLIRSQDKTCLTNMTQVTDIYCSESRNGTMQHLTAVSGETTHLGTYSTEEKAIKVLNMIENFYANIEYTKFMGCGREEFASYIFQMPQDSEVKP